MHRISSGLRHIIWVRANFNLLRPRHVFFTHVSIRKETYHRQVNQLKDYTFIAIHYSYCVVDMKAPDGDVHSLYHTHTHLGHMFTWWRGGQYGGHFALSYLLVVMVVLVGLVASK